MMRSQQIKLCAATACLLLGTLAMPSLVSGAEKVDAKTFDRSVATFIENHCIDCHADATQKGKLNLEALKPTFGDPATVDRWIKVYDKVTSGQMPPHDKPRPPAKDITTASDWLKAKLYDVTLAKQVAQGPTVRRLNRVEYENTVHDLLGIEAELKSMLPTDGQAHGFDNVADGLSISSVLMEKYLRASSKALDDAIFHGFKPQTTTRKTLIKDLKKLEGHIKEGTYLVRDDAVVWFNTGYPQMTAHGFDAPEAGRYRVRIECWPYQPDGRSLAMSVYAGNFYQGDRFFVGYFDVKGSPDKPTIVEIDVTMQKRDTIRVIPYGVHGHKVHNSGKHGKVKPSEYKGMGLAVRSIEAVGPIHEWPTVSHKRLFGKLPLDNVDEGWPGGNRPKSPIYGVRSSDPKADVTSALQAFARRAFRRPVDDKQLAPIIALVQQRMANGYEFEKAARVGFQAMLCSPQFLTLNSASAELDDYAIASRLSYFLWSTMPDDELLKLAEAGKLRDAKVLRQQVERMLNDARSAALTDNFVGQWLDLRLIEDTSPDSKLYPEFDHMLQWSMVRETEQFFQTMLRDDLSVTNFIHSDFITINESLAALYGIKGVRGYNAMQRVKVPADSHRGGVLTQASVLKVTANGTNTSPVLRGVWILENIFGSPVPPPPEAVPAVEPDIRGATTIREQLAKHREVKSCNACHRLIDPPGFALESFDVIGGWRTNYRSLGKGDRVEKEIEGRRVQYRVGPQADPADQLLDGSKFADIDELKKLLLQDKRQIALCVAEKLMIYGRGSGLSFADRVDIGRIVDQVADKDFGLRSLIHEIVQSKAFLTR